MIPVSLALVVLGVLAWHGFQSWLRARYEDASVRKELSSVLEQARAIAAGSAGEVAQLREDVKLLKLKGLGR